MMSLAEIRQILETSSAQRSGATDVWFLDFGPWWQFFTDTRSVESTKKRLLEAAWRLPMPLFFAPERPLADEFVPFVQSQGNAWRIDKNRTAEEFYGTEPVSGMGNWQMYAAAQPLTRRTPNTFRSTSEAVLSFMAEEKVLFLIDVFHDDTDWCIALRESNHTAA
jgi:hypothetical protein